MRLQVCWSVVSLLGIWSTNELLAVTYKSRVSSDLHSVSIFSYSFGEIKIEFNLVIIKIK